MPKEFCSGVSMEAYTPRGGEGYIKLLQLNSRSDSPRHKLTVPFSSNVVYCTTRSCTSVSFFRQTGFWRHPSFPRSPATCLTISRQGVDSLTVAVCSRPIDELASETLSEDCWHCLISSPFPPLFFVTVTKVSPRLATAAVAAERVDRDVIGTTLGYLRFPPELFVGFSSASIAEQCGTAAVIGDTIDPGRRIRDVVPRGMWRNGVDGRYLQEAILAFSRRYRELPESKKAMKSVTEIDPTEGFPVTLE